MKLFSESVFAVALKNAHLYYFEVTTNKFIVQHVAHND